MRPEDVKPGVKVRHYKGEEFEIFALAFVGLTRHASRVILRDNRGRLRVFRIRPGRSDDAFCGSTSAGVERFTLIPGEQS